MMRLVKQRASLFPRPLLIPPIAEFGTHHRKRVRSDLRIAQQSDRVAGALEQFLQVLITHRELMIPPVDKSLWWWSKAGATHIASTCGSGESPSFGLYQEVAWLL